jgi:hypothetical protein
MKKDNLSLFMEKYVSGGTTARKRLKRYQGPEESIVGKKRINPINSTFIFQSGKDTDELLNKGVIANRARCAYTDADGNCLGSAKLYFDRHVASQVGVPNTWSILEDARGSWNNVEGSIDSWDFHGLLQGPGKGTGVFKATEYDSWNKLDKSEQEKIYKWLPLGTVVGMGGANNMYDLSNAINKSIGAIPNRHSGIVVSHMDDGTPLMFDYGEITPLTKPHYNFPITNITVPNEYMYLSPKPNATLFPNDSWASTKFLEPGEEGYDPKEPKTVLLNKPEDWQNLVSKNNPEYSKDVFNTGTVEYDPNDVLLLNKPNIRKSNNSLDNETEYSDEEKIFVNGLNEAIPTLMALTGKSQKELNEKAKVAFGILQNETRGGRSLIASSKQNVAQLREFVGGESASRGLTRMKWTDLIGENNDTKFAKFAKDLGITSATFSGTSADQIKKQAAATLALLLTRSGHIEGIDDLYLNAQQHNNPFPTDEKQWYLRRGEADYANTVIANASRIYSSSTGQGLPQQEEFIKNAQQRFKQSAVNPPAEQNILNQKATVQTNQPVLKSEPVVSEPVLKRTTKRSSGTSETELKIDQEKIDAIRKFLSNTNKETGGPTSSKAKEILTDGLVHGHPLTDKQKKYFGWIAGGMKQDGGSLPIHQGEKSQTGNTKILTYASNPEYFDNRAVYHDNPQYNDLIRKMVYSGTHGFNPDTGELVKLNQPVTVPKDIQALATQVGPTDAATLFRKNPELRNKVIEASTNEAYQNPLMYAPGMIGMSMLPVGFGMSYGLGQAGTQAAQGNYGTAAITAGLSALPLIPHIPKGVTYLKNDFIPRALQSDIASKLVNENILSNLAGRNITLQNMEKYNPVSIGEGGFGRAFQLEKFPNIIVKKGLSSQVEDIMGDVASYSTIPRRSNQIYPRYFSSGRKMLDPESPLYPIEVDYEVMSRVPGESLNQLTTKQIEKIPESAWKELLEQANFLRKNNVGIDWKGDNILYNPSTKRFGIIDLTPGASNTKPYWNEQILGNMSKDMSDLDARNRVKEMIIKKLKSKFVGTEAILKRRFMNELTDNSPNIFTLNSKDKAFANAFGQQMAQRANLPLEDWMMQYRNLSNPNATNPAIDALRVRKENIFSNVRNQKNGGSLTEKQKEYFGFAFE